MATPATVSAFKPSTANSSDPFFDGLAAIPARVAAPPFHGELLSLRWAGGDDAYDYTVCVPVANEEERLPVVLAALSCAAARVEARGLFIFVVNDTRDSSCILIERWAARSGVAHLLIDIEFAPAARNAPHARRLALDIGHACAPVAALLTTDADTRVGPSWIVDNLAELACGAALVCGGIGFDETELGLLPAHVRAIGHAESAYFEVTETLWHLWAGADAGPFNIRASGASLAIAPDAYAAVGGLPTPPAGEDRVLCARLRRLGLPVVQMPAGDTISSARLAARAAHGCGDRLRQRALEANPLCDALLLPLSGLRQLAQVWNGLEAGPERAARFAAYREHWGRGVAPLHHQALLGELEAARCELDELLPHRAVA